MNLKRLIICLIGGAITGILCVLGMKSGGNVAVTPAIIAGGIGNRILIGFVISISQWKINYLLHGALIGIIVTLSSSVAIIAGNVDAGMTGFLMYTVAGAVWGLLIELVATKVFKAGMK